MAVTWMEMLAPIKRFRRRAADLAPQDYTLIWDPKLIRIRPHEAMDYIPEQEPIRKDKVLSQDVREVCADISSLQDSPLTFTSISFTQISQSGIKLEDITLILIETA